MLPLAMQQAQQPIFFDFTSSAPQIVTAWLVCFFTLSVYSFLYRDNPFYKTAEHVFIGAGTAWFALQYYDEGIIDQVFAHIGSALSKAPGEMMELGAYQLSPSWAIFWRSLAAVLGLFLLVRLFRLISGTGCSLVSGLVAHTGLTGCDRCKQHRQTSPWNSPEK